MSQTKWEPFIPRGPTKGTPHPSQSSRYLVISPIVGMFNEQASASAWLQLPGVDHGGSHGYRVPTMGDHRGGRWG